MLGHVGYLSKHAETFRLCVIEECDVDLPAFTPDNSRDIRRVFELQADAHALEMLFLRALWLYPTKRFCAAADGEALDIAPGRVKGPGPIDLAEYRRAARMLVVSAGLVVLLFERKAERTAVAAGGTHPIASSRLINILVAGASLTEEFLTLFTDIHQLEPPAEEKIEEMLVRLLWECRLDLSLVGSFMKIRDKALIYNRKASNPMRTPFADDLFDIYRGAGDPDIPSLKMRTAGAREFTRLYALNKAMFARLEPFQLGGLLLGGARSAAFLNDAASEA
jgi:hypothetical protein